MKKEREREMKLSGSMWKSIKVNKESRLVGESKFEGKTRRCKQQQRKAIKYQKITTTTTKNST